MRKSMLLIVTLVFMSIGAAYATEWVTISGTVLYDEKPLNVMVLANGQYMFTDPSDGRYEMDVPLAENGEITLFSFCDGFAPFKEILGSNEAGTFDIRMSVAPSESMILTLTHEAQPLENGWVEISGIATYDGKP
ncbi:MAG: hypothetical protein GY749_48220, partial [Desulfobacteraceae bacterium]|nr:hypothetical protein [Desulfobacteraceae bacterium]